MLRDTDVIIKYIQSVEEVLGVEVDESKKVNIEYIGIELDEAYHKAFETVQERLVKQEQFYWSTY